MKYVEDSILEAVNRTAKAYAKLNFWCGTDKLDRTQAQVRSAPVQGPRRTIRPTSATRRAT